MNPMSPAMERGTSEVRTRREVSDREDPGGKDQDGSVASDLLPIQANRTAEKELRTDVSNLVSAMRHRFILKLFPAGAGKGERLVALGKIPRY